MNRTITKSIKTKWISLPVDFSSRIVCTAVVPSSAVKTSTFERKPPLSFSLSISRVMTLQFMSESSCHSSYRPIMLSRTFSAQGWEKTKQKDARTYHHEQSHERGRHSMSRVVGLLHSHYIVCIRVRCNRSLRGKVTLRQTDIIKLDIKIGTLFIDIWKPYWIDGKSKGLWGEEFWEREGLENTLFEEILGVRVPLRRRGLGCTRLPPFEAYRGNSK